MEERSYVFKIPFFLPYRVLGPASSFRDSTKDPMKRSPLSRAMAPAAKRMPSLSIICFCVAGSYFQLTVCTISRIPAASSINAKMRLATFSSVVALGMIMADVVWNRYAIRMMTSTVMTAVCLKKYKKERIKTRKNREKIKPINQPIDQLNYRYKEMPQGRQHFFKYSNLTEIFELICQSTEANTELKNSNRCKWEKTGKEFHFDWKRKPNNQSSEAEC